MKMTTEDQELITEDLPVTGKGKIMTALDLCCGLSGWADGFIATGWRVIGIDLKDLSADYPGEFVQADLSTWEGWRSIPADLVLASPPCEEFSRCSMPRTRKLNPPEPSLALVNRCREIAMELQVPIVLENVRGAQTWLGRSAMNCGLIHLWGDIPALVPTCHRAKRAVIPFELAAHFARCFKNYRKVC